MKREFTEQDATRDAARLTRKAIGKMQEAVMSLQNCAAHWDDLDTCLAEICRHVRATQELADLSGMLDELYPTRKRKAA